MIIPPPRILVTMCRLEQALEGVGAIDLLNRRKRRENEGGQPPPPEPHNLLSSVNLERTKLAIRKENELFRGHTARRDRSSNEYSWRHCSETPISNLVVRTHNIGKKPPIPFVVHHFKEGVHLLALQEVNMDTGEFKEVLSRIFPGATLFGYTNGRSNGSVLVVHPTLAPFARPLTCKNLGTVGNVQECIAAVTINIPKEPTFHIFGIYISGHDAGARAQVAATITPWLATPALFLGDMNHVQSPVLDSLNQGALADWPWLRTQLTISDRHRPTLIDFFRVTKPQDTTLTRPQLARDGTSKGSRIDYILGTENTRPWIASSRIAILTTQLGSDHRPVELTKSIQPFTPPHNTINAILRISEFSDDQLKKFHDMLQPISGLAAILPHAMGTQSDTQVAEDAELVFECLEIAARKVTGKQEHQKQLSAKEKELDRLINQPSDDSFRDRADQLTKEIAEEATAKATKRLHAALVKGVGMKKAIQNFNNNVSPPIALISSTGEVASTPQENCSIMSDTLLSLGGKVDYKVPEEVENNFLRDVKHAPPPKRLFPPHMGSIPKHH